MVELLKGGLLTTIQDLGRKGYRRYGIPEGGVMDEYNARLANWLAGNPPEAALLEIILHGPTLKFYKRCNISITGADISATVNGVNIQRYETIPIKKGDELAFGKIKSGCRCYLAINGGFKGDKFLGSSATYIPAGWGGVNGRALTTGDKLEIYSKQQRAKIKSVPEYLQTKFQSPVKIRFIEGPEFDFITEESPMGLTGSYTVNHKSDRMGIRLNGFIGELSDKEIISSPANKGTIQALPDNSLMVLMNDGPVTGGYPRIGSVISADLHLLAQVKPGDEITLQQVSFQEAVNLHLYRQGLLKNLP